MKRKMILLVFCLLLCMTSCKSGASLDSNNTTTEYEMTSLSNENSSFETKNTTSSSKNQLSEGKIREIVLEEINKYANFDDYSPSSTDIIDIVEKVLSEMNNGSSGSVTYDFNEIVNAVVAILEEKDGCDSIVSSKSPVSSKPPVSSESHVSSEPNVSVSPTSSYWDTSSQLVSSDDFIVPPWTESSQAESRGYVIVTPWIDSGQSVSWEY